MTGEGYRARLSYIFVIPAPIVIGINSSMNPLPLFECQCLDSLLHGNDRIGVVR